MTIDRLSVLWANTAPQPSYSPKDWETILGQARQARLLAKLAILFVDNGWMSAVPAKPSQYLEGGLRLAERQHHEALWEVGCIRRALKDIDCPIVLLKGAAYLMAGLPPGRGRLFSDIDVMVPSERIDDVENALFCAGWISEERDAYNDRYYRQWMHEIPPMKHVQRNTVIDLHHTITPPTSHFRVDGAKLFGNIEPVGSGENLYVLAPADMVLHSAVHLFQEGEFSHGLRDLLDLNELLMHFSKDPEFWNALFARATELGLGEPLFHALHHTHRLFGTQVPGTLRSGLKHIRPNCIRRQVMSMLLNTALKPDHPSCDGPFSGIARWLLYVRSHHLRMPWYLVIPHLMRKAVMRFSSEKKHHQGNAARPATTQK